MKQACTDWKRARPSRCTFQRVQPIIRKNILVLQTLKIGLDLPAAGLSDEASYNRPQTRQGTGLSLRDTEVLVLEAASLLPSGMARAACRSRRQPTEMIQASGMRDYDLRLKGRGVHGVHPNATTRSHAQLCTGPFR